MPGGGWPVSATADASLVIAAPDMAWQSRRRPGGVLFHSDQGCQYGSRAFRQRLWRYRMTQSMRRRGNCHDNAVTGRLFRSLKTERVPATGCQSFWQARKDAGDYFMRYYNKIRPHSDNGGLSPVAAENQSLLLSGNT